MNWLREFDRRHSRIYWIFGTLYWAIIYLRNAKGRGNEKPTGQR